MNSLDRAPIAELLNKLHQDAEAADREFMTAVMADMDAAGRNTGTDGHEVACRGTGELSGDL